MIALNRTILFDFCIFVDFFLFFLAFCHCISTFASAEVWRRYRKSRKLKILTFSDVKQNSVGAQRSYHVDPDIIQFARKNLFIDSFFLIFFQIIIKIEKKRKIRIVSFALIESHQLIEFLRTRLCSCAHVYTLYSLHIAYKHKNESVR